MSSQQAVPQVLDNPLSLDSPNWDAVGDALRTNGPAFIALQESEGNKVLHIACVKNAPVDVVRLIVQLQPGEVKTLDNCCNLPLHAACYFEHSLEVIQLLIGHHPDAVKKKNNAGCLPFHLACETYQSLGVIQFLFNLHPDVIKEKNGDGHLPLHVACTRNQSLKVIQWLVQQYPKAVKEKSNNDSLPLHLACQLNHSFKVIQWLAQRHVDAVRAKSSDGNLPLHMACGCEQSFQVIQWLAQKYPNAVKEKNHDCELPLHLACGCNQSFKVIHWLVQKHPRAVKEKNDTGNLPLHIACTSKQSFQVIQFLVQQHPNAIKEKSAMGNLPLHCACYYNQAFDVIQWLARQHPNTVKENNNQGDFPLHFACASKQSLEVIDFLVQQHPDAIAKKNENGYLPLHLACAFKQSLEVIDVLVQHYPDAITTNNKGGDLPLHLACEFQQSLEVIQALVKLHPDAVKEKNRNGRTPCELARNTEGDISPDAGTLRWLETVESGQINLATEKSDGLAQKPTVVDIDLGVTGDRCSVQDILEEKNEVASASYSYLESHRNEEIIRNGFFGTVCKGTDTKLHSRLAIKAINTDLLRVRGMADNQKAKETFMLEIKKLSIFRHPIIKALYAGACPDDVRFSYSELPNKGSLEAFWKADLGPERLSLFRRRIQIALDILTAIQFLHVGNDEIASCCHGDIKSANIVLKRDFTAQIINCCLPQFGVDSQLDAGAKGSTGVACPEYTCGGMRIERSCDIYSFGAVLAELLTGTLQNRSGEFGLAFRFVKQRFQDKNNLIRDIKMYLDPALGYDTWQLPKYVRAFADLANCCLQPNPDDRLLGDAILTKLVAIWSQCGSHNSDVNSSINTGDPVPSSLEKYKGKCKFCRTFPPVPLQGVCAVCHSAQERRARLSFRDETRGCFVATKATLDDTHSRIIHLDVRLTNPVPRLFLLVPFAMKTAMKNPRTWLRREHRTRYYIYFLCMNSMNAIAPALPIIVTKRWVEKVAPVLAMSLVLLQLGLKPDGGIDVGYKESGLRLELSSTRIAEMLDAVGDVLIETGNFDFLVRLRRNLVLDPLDINLLNGEAYELIVERACEETGWRDCMEPVKKNGSPQISWVSKDVAYDADQGYDIVHMS